MNSPSLTVLSLMGALAAALAVLVVAPVVSWRTGVQAAIAALVALGVPTVHNIGTSSGVDGADVPATSAPPRQDVP